MIFPSFWISSSWLENCVHMQFCKNRLVADYLFFFILMILIPDVLQLGVIAFLVQFSAYLRLHIYLSSIEIL